MNTSPSSARAFTSAAASACEVVSGSQFVEVGLGIDAVGTTPARP